LGLTPIIEAFISEAFKAVFSNSISRLLHEVEEEVEIVDRAEHGGQDFVGFMEVAKVAATEILACVTGTS